MSFQVYFQRPDGTSLWLPFRMARGMKLERGDRLTAEQYGDIRIQDLLARRLEKKGAIEDQ